jgi:alkanesulfonate monooxygenase SsuD/methylene tetrahydromethanopterin reductase-like flavin-dependent oxidoreductase (luciferase family)
MRFGLIILPVARWPAAGDPWRRAEDLGFDHAWTYDHIAWREYAARPWFSAIPTLVAAAMVTSRIRLGTLVASPNFRHPATLAKDVVALDDISGGRAILGLGAGAGGSDANVLGRRDLSAVNRADRFAEFVELTDLLLRQETSGYDGRHYQARDAVMIPGCVQEPRLPLAVAATGPRGLRVAAAYGDYWITNGSSARGGALPPEISPGLVRSQVARLEAAGAAVGRDTRSLRKIVVHTNRNAGLLESADAFRVAAHEYAELGITDLVVPFPQEGSPFGGKPEVLAEISESVLPHLRKV